jgi:PPOX class probable F420-dependent enzyme
MATTTNETVIPEHYRDLLESTALAHVATIGPNGEPQNNPVWFGWDGTHIRFSQTTTRQKTKNLERDPRISLSIVDPANPYRYIEIRGKLVAVEPDPDIDFISRMAKKYMGVDRYPWHNPKDERIVMVVEPVHTTQMGS